MKVKTSITLSEDVLNEVDRQTAGQLSRSEFIENAIVAFVRQLSRKRRDAKDLRIINRRATHLNREAEDVLAYQGDV